MDSLAAKKAVAISGGGLVALVAAVVPLGMKAIDYMEKRMEIKMQWQVANTGTVGPPDPREAAQQARLVTLPDEIERLKSQVDSCCTRP